MSSNFVTSPGLSQGIGPLASSGSVFRSCMKVIFSALSVLAMVKKSRMIAAAVTIGGIVTYQDIVIELRPKGSNLKLKRK